MKATRAIVLALVVVGLGCAQERNVYTHSPKCQSDRECEEGEVCADGSCANGDRRTIPGDAGVPDTEADSDSDSDSDAEAKTDPS